MSLHLLALEHLCAESASVTLKQVADKIDLRLFFSRLNNLVFSAPLCSRLSKGTNDLRPKPQRFKVPGSYIFFFFTVYKSFCGFSLKIADLLSVLNNFSKYHPATLSEYEVKLQGRRRELKYFHNKRSHMGIKADSIVSFRRIFSSSLT